MNVADAFEEALRRAGGDEAVQRHREDQAAKREMHEALFAQARQSSAERQQRIARFFDDVPDSVPTAPMSSGRSDMPEPVDLDAVTESDW